MTSHDSDRSSGVPTEERECDDGSVERSLGALFRAMQSENPATVEEAWGECYRRYNEKVWGRIVYVLRTIPGLKEPHELAIDVTGEVFARLPAAVRQYRETGEAEGWLMRVAVRAALRQKEMITGNWGGVGRSPSGSSWPKSGSVRRLRVDLEDAVSEVVAVADAVEPEARMELTRRLESWRGDPAKQRWLDFVELFLEGFGHEAIAERLGITPAASRTWLWKIRRELGRAP